MKLLNWLPLLSSCCHHIGHHTGHHIGGTSSYASGGTGPSHALFASVNDNHIDIVWHGSGDTSMKSVCCHEVYPYSPGTCGYNRWGKHQDGISKCGSSPTTGEPTTAAPTTALTVTTSVGPSKWYEAYDDRIRVDNNILESTMGNDRETCCRHITPHEGHEHQYCKDWGGSCPEAWSKRDDSDMHKCSHNTCDEDDCCYRPCKELSIYDLPSGTHCTLGPTAEDNSASNHHHWTCDPKKRSMELLF